MTKRAAHSADTLVATGGGDHASAAACWFGHFCVSLGPDRRLPAGIDLIKTGINKQCPTAGRWRVHAGRLAGAAGLWLLVCAVFWPVLSYDFVRWDDDINVTGNAMMSRPWSWSLVGDFFDPQAALRFKPLHWVFLRFVADMDGFNPPLWHAVGLVFHAGSAVVLFAVLRMALRKIFTDPADRRRDLLAWLGAALWAVHPLRVEPVAWVTASTYPMAGFFLVASFGAYLKAHESGDIRGRWLALAWILAVAAYATYPVSVTYAGWLMTVDIFWLKAVPKRPWQWTDRRSRLWSAKFGIFVAPAIAAVGFTLWTRLLAPGRWGAAPGLDEVGWDERILSAWATLARFPAKILWPVDLTPNHPEIRGTLWLNGGVLALAATAFVAAVALWACRKRYPVAAWIGAGYVLLVLPCLGLTENPATLVDRYGYLPDMVWMGGAVVAVGAMMRKRRINGPVWAVLSFCVCASVAGTRQSLPAWRDSDALFARMEANPRFGDNVAQQAHVYLTWCKYLRTTGRYREAAVKAGKARESYVEGMRKALVAEAYGEAVALAFLMEANLGLPPHVRRERGMWLLKMGRTREARDDLQRALKESPEDERAAVLLQFAEGIPRR